MTVAVCIACGAVKHGAFTTCGSCGFLPNKEDDLALSMALTDHYHAAELLKEVGKRIGEGQQFHLDEASMAQMKRLLRESRVREIMGHAVPEPRTPWWRKLLRKA